MGLWAHWPLTGGSLVDASGHGRDLALVAGGLAGPASSGVADPTGGGSRLFGPHQAADTGPDQPYHGLVSPNLPACATWTWEAWVRLNSLPGSNHAFTIMQQRPGANTWLWVAGDQFGPGGLGHLWTFNGTSVISVGAIAVGVWTHVGLSYDGTVGQFWLGGVPEGPLGGLIPLSSGFPLRLGYDETDAHISSFCDKVLDGYLADVKMWDAYVPLTSPGGWSAGVIR